MLWRMMPWLACGSANSSLLGSPLRRRDVGAGFSFQPTATVAASDLLAATATFSSL